MSRKIISICLLVTLMLSMFAAFGITSSAATLGTKKSCISYNYNTGKTTYRNEYYYSVEKNDKLKLECFWSSEKLNNQSFAGLKLKNYLRFDVHIIDAQTGKVVKYWYGLKPNATFKVYSEVPSINRMTYTVKVTSYLSNYKTYVNTNLAGVATCLKYRLV